MNHLIPTLVATLSSEGSEPAILAEMHLGGLGAAECRCPSSEWCCSHGRYGFHTLLTSLVSSHTASAFPHVLEGGADRTLGWGALFHGVDMRQAPAWSPTASSRGVSNSHILPSFFPLFPPKWIKFAISVLLLVTNHFLTFKAFYESCINNSCFSCSLGY